MYHRRAEADIVDEQSSKTQPKTRDSLTWHGQNGGREKQCSLSEKRGKTPNVDDHQPSPEEDEPDKPAKSHSKERHPDEKTDLNPETGDQPPEKGEAESESVGVEAQGSETDGDTPVGAEKPDRAIENEIPNSNERHPDEKTDPNPKTGDQSPEKGEAESESVGVEARGSETDGETPVGAEHDDFSAFSKQKAKGKYC